jgi:hypothetical protein
MDKLTQENMPVPMLQYLGEGKFTDNRNSVKDESVLMHWLLQDQGETYRLQWWNNGWVVFYQESYLTKDLRFKHKNDIPGFAHSHFGDSVDWQHVFQTLEDAIYYFKLYWTNLHDQESIKNLRNTI